MMFLPIVLTLDRYPSSQLDITFTEEDIQELRSVASHACLQNGYRVYRVPGWLRLVDEDSDLILTFSPIEGLEEFEVEFMSRTKERRLQITASMKQVWAEIYRGFNPPSLFDLPLPIAEEIEPYLVRKFKIRGISFKLRRFGLGQSVMVLQNDDFKIPMRDGCVTCVVTKRDYIEENQWGFSLHFRYGLSWERPEESFEFTVRVGLDRTLSYSGCDEKLATEIAGFLL